MSENKQLLVSLKRKLLTLGGERVLDYDLTFLKEVVEQGHLMDYPIRKTTGVKRNCHRNAISHWIMRPRRKIATGWALIRGTWLRHSWLLHAGQIIETTVPCQLYFGYIPSGMDLLFFCMSEITDLAGIDLKQQKQQAELSLASSEQRQ